MIVPPPGGGVAFTDATDGDVRHDGSARLAVSEELGIPDSWATVSQVHGDTVMFATAPGRVGEADALWTNLPGLPVVVFTADCLPVVVKAADAVGVAHAGWRGVVAGVVPELLLAMRSGGHAPLAAYVGPGIGPCCFEVGSEVAEVFSKTTETSWGTVSVDLATEVTSQIDGVEVWLARRCTRHEESLFSHRRDQSTARQAGIGWVT